MQSDFHPEPGVRPRGREPPREGPMKFVHYEEPAEDSRKSADDALTWKQGQMRMSESPGKARDYAREEGLFRRFRVGLWPLSAISRRTARASGRSPLAAVDVPGRTPGP